MPPTNNSQHRSKVQCRVVQTTHVVRVSGSVQAVAPSVLVQHEATTARCLRQRWVPHHHLKTRQHARRAVHYHALPCIAVDCRAMLCSTAVHCHAHASACMPRPGKRCVQRRTRFEPWCKLSAHYSVYSSVVYARMCACPSAPSRPKRDRLRSLSR